MSRPVGSEEISLDDLHDAAQRVRARIGGRATLSQVALATEAGISETGLRAWHRRRGMTFPALREVLDYLPVPSRSQPVTAPDDDDVKALWVPIDPDVAEALRELARAEHRHPRETAALILAEAVRRRQPKHRPPLAPVA